ncbi:MAG: hypothetical protein JWQ01_3813 [Massilia sp.]|nr:hypothetical protein [Massilia sp.]
MGGRIRPIRSKLVCNPPCGMFLRREIWNAFRKMVKAVSGPPYIRRQAIRDGDIN